MTSEEIKAECEKCYEDVKKIETRLSELRAKCSHPKTTYGLYAGFRLYHTDICDYCGTPIHKPEEMKWEYATKEQAENIVVVSVPNLEQK